MNSNKQFPLVTVIIPCYNQDLYLPDAINCLIHQTYKNWECIIVNDGSTDNSKNIADSFAENESRIKIIHQKNKGLSAARNVGLDAASGKYIQFLDADDVIEVSKLSIQVEAILKYKDFPFICYSDYRYGSNDDINITIKNNNYTPARFIKDLPIYDFAVRWETEFSIPIHAFLFDSYFFNKKSIRFDETLSNHEDWDCWMQIFNFNPKIYFVEGEFSIYRLSKKGLTTNKKKMVQGFHQAIKKQQHIFHKDQVISHMLSEKLVEIQSIYLDRYSIFTLTPYSKLNLIYKRNIPWPLQKVVTRFFYFLSMKYSL